MSALLTFLPMEFSVPLFIAAAIALILGAKKIAMTMFGASIAMVLLPPLIAPLFDLVPLWLLLLLMVGVTLSTIRVLLNLGFGRESTDHAVGNSGRRDKASFAFAALKAFSGVRIAHPDRIIQVEDQILGTATQNGKLDFRQQLALHVQPRFGRGWLSLKVKWMKLVRLRRNRLLWPELKPQNLA